MSSSAKADNLFRQPDGTHLGECPICFLPLPIHPKQTTFKPCCGKLICLGCVIANMKINRLEKVKALSCPLCREPYVSEEEDRKRHMKRIEANDPVAMMQMGGTRYNEGDYNSAFEYLTKSAELGDEEAHFNLYCMYANGEGVKKDMDKEVYHLEKAAIGGHPDARFNLAVIERKNLRTDRAVKHFIIAAKLGEEASMKELWKHYSDGNITKEDLEATLRTHKAAIDAAKSSQRDEAENYWKLGLLKT